jgi:hypothetical protein
MSVLIVLIILVCLVSATILVMPFVIFSRLARMEKRQAELCTEELRRFISELKMEEENETRSAGRHREQVVADPPNCSFQPTSDELEQLFGDSSELADLAQLVEDIRNQPSHNPNNYDHRD